MLQFLMKLRAAYAAGEFTEIEFGTRFADIPAMKDGASVEVDSQDWAGKFLRPKASPWRRFVRIERAYRAADDKLGADAIVHHYRLQGSEPSYDLGLAVYETSGELYVIVEDGADDLLALEPEKRVDRLDGIAGKLLNMEGTWFDVLGSVPYHWELLFTGDVRQGMTFTSAPGVSYVTLTSWAKRIDGGIAPFGLYFMLHKARYSSGMMIELDQAHWFDGLSWKRIDDRVNARHRRAREDQERKGPREGRGEVSDAWRRPDRGALRRSHCGRAGGRLPDRRPRRRLRARAR